MKEILTNEPRQKKGNKLNKPLFKGKYSIKMVLIITLLTSAVFVSAGFIGEKAISDHPELCLACHNMQPYYDSWQHSNLEANKHAVAGITCHDCHKSSIPDQVNQVWKYATSDYETPLEKRDFGTVEFCTDCHEFASFIDSTNYEESNPHNSHNGLLECNECHQSHGDSQVFCNQCHTFDWASTLPENWGDKPPQN